MYITISSRQSTTSSPSDTATCITGGSNFTYPSSNPPWAGLTWVGIEGNDTSPASTFSQCCSREPLQFVAPCVLWCELGDERTLAQMKQCWADKGFHPQAVEGSTTSGQQSGQGGMASGGITGLVVGVGVVVAVLGVVAWRILRRRGDRPASRRAVTEALPAGRKSVSSSESSIGGQDRDL